MALDTNRVALPGGRAFRAIVTVLFLALALALGVCIGGCGKKRPPMPVAAKVPETVSGLHYTLREGLVEISFRAPERYQDRSLLKGSDRLIILRARVPFADRDCPDCPRKFEELLGVTLDFPRGLVRKHGRMFYADQEVSPNVQYLYEVVVQGEDGAVSPVSKRLVMDVTEPPDAPPSISGRYGAREVSLSWSKVAHPEKTVYYNVYRREEGQESFARINRSPLVQNSYVDDTAQPEKVYVYGVRAGLKERGTMSESALSRLIDAGPILYHRPPAPDGLVAIPRGDAVELKWEPVKAEGLRGYRVYRIGGGKGQIVLTPSLVTDTVYRDAAVERGAVYGYAVTAVAGEKTDAESLYSAWKDVFLP